MFAKFARANFGLKRNSTVEDVRNYFGDTIILLGPDRNLHLP